MAVAGRAPAARVCSRSVRLPSVLSFLLFFLQNLPGNFVFYSVFFFFSLIFFFSSSSPLVAAEDTFCLPSL